MWFMPSCSSGFPSMGKIQRGINLGASAANLHAAISIRAAMGV
jgi:hypothetical protein